MGLSRHTACRAWFCGTGLGELLPHPTAAWESPGVIGGTLMVMETGGLLLLGPRVDTGRGHLPSVQSSHDHRRPRPVGQLRLPLPPCGHLHSRRLLLHAYTSALTHSLAGLPSIKEGAVGPTVVSLVNNA